jgi:hypothetical protein
MRQLDNADMFALVRKNPATLKTHQMPLAPATCPQPCAALN